MKLSRLGEFGLIEAIRRRTTTGRGVRIGMGDDCAWIDHFAGSSLVTADLLVESIHFNLKWTSLDALGHKALAVNLSDIAAMGGVPAYAILSLGVPGTFESNDIIEFYRGFNRLARRCGVGLIGGDTNIAKTLIVSVCVIGHPPTRPVRRSGAKVGDDIYVTGTLGDSALGLAFLSGHLPGLKRAGAAQLLARHYRPTPRLTVGSLLARQHLATAMIDVSDGLLQDLGHICHASGTGAMIWHERVPLSRSYLELVEKIGTDFAFNGGEDYELLFTARRRQRTRIEKLSARAQVPITRIGRSVTPDHDIKVIDNSGRPLVLQLKGHDHFRK